jgi:hypothetical protein
MHCAKCNAKLDLTLARCAACGVAIREGGLPDEIAAYIESRVRDVLAGEKDREAAELARSSAEEELRELRTQLDHTREALRRNEREPRSFWHWPLTTVLQRGAVVLPISTGLGVWVYVSFSVPPSITILASCALLCLPALFFSQTMRRGQLHAEREAMRETEAELIRKIAASEPPSAQTAPYR